MNAMDVIIKYAVSERSESSAWGDLVRAAHEAYANGSDVAEALKAGETAFKEQSDQPLPARYRSAKSVLLKAWATGVATMGDNGEPLGKSAVEAAIKAAAVPKNKEPSDMVENALVQMRKAYNLCEAEAERIALKAYIEANIHSVWS